VRAVDPAAVVVRTSLILGDAEVKQVGSVWISLSGRQAGALFSDGTL
jgi:carbonic anhydrase/acetyltransferase-like protein (isoleucine patch superfamily)